MQRTISLGSAHGEAIAESKPTSRNRVRIALVVSGITVGVLALFGLQFVIPYFLGPLGVLIVVALDAVIYLEFRHRKAMHRRPRMIHRFNPGARGPSLATGKRPVHDEVLATLGLFALLIGSYLAGTGLRYETVWNGTEVLVYFVGTAITSITLAGLIYMVYPYPTGLRMRTESEAFDTTDDH